MVAKQGTSVIGGACYLINLRAESQTLLTSLWHGVYFKYSWCS